MIGRITSTLVAPVKIATRVATFLHGSKNARRAERSVARHVQKNYHHERYVSRRLRELAHTQTLPTTLATDELAS